MRGGLVAILVVVASGPAMAQAVPTVDLSACRTLTRHRPAPDVAYKPGVDVRGRPVAPADLPGSAGAEPPIDRFEIPVTLDMARRMGLPVPSGGLRGNTAIGALVLDGDRLSFNGQPIGGAAEAQLYAYCRAR